MSSPASREGPHDLDTTIRWILGVPRTWAVAGLSPDPRRDSHRIPRLLR